MNHQIQAVYDEKSNRIIGRLKKDVDLFEGILAVCAQYGVKAAQFQCIGSLAYATIVQPQQNPDKSLQYSERIVTDTPVELLSGTGFIGYDEERKLDIHFHGLYVDCDKQLNGGHFLRGENPVAITVEFIIFPVADTGVQRKPDEFSGIPLFHFTNKE
ncbi:PPC domain-containing DNA-binding protein [Sporosarcina ureae]|uniref:PPC domain-containing DNA-binding protein n=1 Tax=Sporosarcina ureae TaxID=1571 RepID=UPI0026EB4765|nr:PPC domain-containing DNA-binding protein [Sporosarcina ureae]